jgi:hypothetical protein
MFKREKGIVLVMVIVIAIILAIVGLGVLILAEQESVVTKIDADKAKAFYLAEAGLAKIQESFQSPISGSIVEMFKEPIHETLAQGSYSVAIVEEDANYFVVSTGVCGKTKEQIRVQASFLATPFEDAVYASNRSGANWAFQLRGTGNPVVGGSGLNTTEKGGKDTINGNIAVVGDVYMYDQSSVNKAPAPNKYNLQGDVISTKTINLFNSAKVTGTKYPNSAVSHTFSLTSMDYANNCTHNVAKIFQDAGVSSGYLPSSNELRNVFVKNPSDRNNETGATTGNDYFLEPSTGFVIGNYNTGETPVHLGNKRVYYVDGDVWVHSKQTMGFKVDGQATIVATGNIHICDNIQYKDSNSLLGLVALGKYDAAGNLISGGNIYFGDAVYGTMYVISGMMFAANNFLFNTDAVSNRTGEPTTGFTVNGNFAALNQVSLIVDWYTPSATSHHDRYSGSTRTGFGGWYYDRFHYSNYSTTVPSSMTSGAPAYYDVATGKWYDAETNIALTTTGTSSDKSTLRHYQMIINYDERVRNTETRPPMLPRGGSQIFAGFSNWKEQ